MDNKNKIKLYRALGAEKFQKVVFAVEKLKYKILRKFSPKIITWYEKQCNKQYNRQIKKNKSVDKQQLLEYYQQEKLLFRKEIVQGKNRNYHYDPNHPTEFIKYLELNKKIHKKGLINNIMFLVGLIATIPFLGSSYPILIGSLIILDFVSLIINFECINLQNYNLCRFKAQRIYNALQKQETRKLEQNLRKLSEGMKPVSKTINTNLGIPTMDQIIENITTKEQAKQLLEYAKEQLEVSKTQENKLSNSKKKKIGGY